MKIIKKINLFKKMRAFGIVEMASGFIGLLGTVGSMDRAASSIISIIICAVISLGILFSGYIIARRFDSLITESAKRIAQAKKRNERNERRYVYSESNSECKISSIA